MNLFEAVMALERAKARVEVPQDEIREKADLLIRSAGIDAGVIQKGIREIMTGRIDEDEK